MAGDLPRYDISAEIDPTAQTLKASARLAWPVNPGTDRLTFLLHRDLAVDAVNGSAVRAYSFAAGPSPYGVCPEAGVLTIELTPVAEAAAVELVIMYSGRLGVITPWTVNRLTAEWLELGVYTPWFPYQPEAGQFEFSVRLALTPGYRLVGNGSCVQQQHGAWTMDSLGPSPDIDLIAAPDLQECSDPAATGTGRVTAYCVDRSAAPVAFSLAAAGAQALTFLQGWLDGGATAREARVVLLPRQQGGAYARPGLVVYSDVNPADYDARKQLYFKSLSHEFAHFWWNRAPFDAWEDWLNESMAECSAYLAVRAVHGEPAYQDMLQRKRQASEGLPAIRGLNRADRESETTYSVLYNKGCVLLLDLAEEITLDRYTALMRRLLAHPRLNTDLFIQELKGVAGLEAAERFSQALSR